MPVARREDNMAHIYKHTIQMATLLKLLRISRALETGHNVGPNHYHRSMVILTEAPF